MTGVEEQMPPEIAVQIRAGEHDVDRGPGIAQQTEREWTQ
jgi:hypothetical protein